MTKKRVLIANRGEIALRIIRSVKELDMEAIAVYSDVDADSLHVKRADEAYYLGGSLPSESYRNIKTLMKAITDTKADMVHPANPVKRYINILKDPKVLPSINPASITTNV